MKCESCGNELTGGAIICRVCNHNNALRSDWRSQRSNQRPGQQAAPRRPGETQPNQSRATSPMTELPRIVPRKDADANLIRFPPAANKQESRQTEAPRPAPSPASESDTAAQPAWRAELKERVRQIREKRNTGELGPPPAPPDQVNEVNLDRNPIVESALNRIRWSSHTPPVTTSFGAGSQSARATARLVQPEPEPAPEPRPQPRSEARPEPRFASPKPNPAVSRPADQPKIQTASRAETRTLTPKTHREAGARPEPPPAPASKILTPRAKPQAEAEPKVEPIEGRRATDAPPRPPVNRPAVGQPSISKPLAGAPDKHVETQVIEIAQAPEPPPLPEAAPASLWVRTFAGYCDFVIIAIAYLPIFYAYAVLNTSLSRDSFFIMLTLLSAIVFIYQVVMLKFAGRTFGMALLNLNLVNTDDESLPITSRQTLLRALVATITFVFPPLHLCARLNLSQRSLPDWLSGTTVAEQ